MTHRFFAAADDQTWEQIRASLDALWGHPDAYTETCAPPASELSHDANGRPLLAVDVPFLQYEAVAEMLPALLASGAVEELTAEQFSALAVRRDNLWP
jgi:hypothetical protein